MNWKTKCFLYQVDKTGSFCVRNLLEPASKGGGIIPLTRAFLFISLISELYGLTKRNTKYVENLPLNLDGNFCYPSYSFYSIICWREE